MVPPHWWSAHEAEDPWCREVLDPKAALVADNDFTIMSRATSEIGQRLKLMTRMTIEIKIWETFENLWGGRGVSSSCKGSPNCGGLNFFEELFHWRWSQRETITSTPRFFPETNLCLEESEVEEKKEEKGGETWRHKIRHSLAGGSSARHSDWKGKNQAIFGDTRSAFVRVLKISNISKKTSSLWRWLGQEA